MRFQDTLKVLSDPTAYTFDFELNIARNIPIIKGIKNKKVDRE